MPILGHPLAGAVVLANDELGGPLHASIPRRCQRAPARDALPEMQTEHDGIVERSVIHEQVAVDLLAMQPVVGVERSIFEAAGGGVDVGAGKGGDAGHVEGGVD